MTLSEAKARSKSVITTLRSLGVADTEVRHRLITHMGYAPAFVDIQIAKLPKPEKQERGRCPVTRTPAMLFKGGLAALVHELTEGQLNDKAHLKAVRKVLLDAGYTPEQINAALGNVKSKLKRLNQL